MCAITDGPSKFDLMLALFRDPGAHHRMDFLTFSIEGCEPNQVMIRSVAVDDDSCEGWIIEGFRTRSKGGRFKATYSTQTRRGMVLVDD